MVSLDGDIERAKYDGMDRYCEPPSTRVKNERESIRNILIQHCDTHNMMAEKEKIIHMRTSWELIKECVKWFPGKEGQLPDEFIKAVSFPVIQGAGKQAGKGYRLLKHKLTGAKKSAADSLQQRIRRDIDNWLRNQQLQTQQGYQQPDNQKRKAWIVNVDLTRCQMGRKDQDPLANIGLEAAKDHKSLRDIKANWVRLAHHYNIDYSEQLGGPSMEHHSRVKPEPDYHGDGYKLSYGDGHTDHCLDEVTRLLNEALKIIQRAKEDGDARLSGLHRINDAISNFAHAKRPRLEPGMVPRTAPVNGLSVGMEIDPPLYNVPGRNFSIKMHHSTKHENEDPNTVECSQGWDKNAPKRRFYSKDFVATPFEKDFSKLRSMDFVCHNRFSFGLDRASVSPDKRILEFTIPIPPDATKCCRMPSTESPVYITLKCDVQLTSCKDDEPPIFVKPFTYIYPQVHYPEEDNPMPTETPHNIGELPRIGWPPNPGFPGFQSGGDFAMATVGVGNAAPPVDISYSQEIPGLPPLEKWHISDKVSTHSIASTSMDENVEASTSTTRGEFLELSPEDTITTTKGSTAGISPESTEGACGNNKMLLEYIYQYDLENVRKWYESNENVSSDTYFDSNLGRSAFDVVCLKNYMKMAKLLLELDPELDVNFEGEKGENALCSAIFCGHLDMISFLLEHGADVNIEAPHIRGNSLCLAVCLDDCDITEILASTGKVNWDAEATLERTVDGKTMRLDGLSALHLSVLGENPVLVALILKHAPRKILDSRCRQDITPLIYAIRAGNSEIVEILLGFNPQLDLRTSDNLTALDYAYKNMKSQPRIYDMLIEHPLVDLAVHVDLSETEDDGESPQYCEVRPDIENESEQPSECVQNEDLLAGDEHKDIRAQETYVQHTYVPDTYEPDVYVQDTYVQHVDGHVERGGHVDVVKVQDCEEGGKERDDEGVHLEQSFDEIHPTGSQVVTFEAGGNLMLESCILSDPEVESVVCSSDDEANEVDYPDYADYDSEDSEDIFATPIQLIPTPSLSVRPPQVGSSNNFTNSKGVFLGNFPRQSGAQQVKDLESWSKSEVCEWVSSFGKEFQKYEQIFDDNGIDGETLVHDFDEALKLIPVTLHRNKIMRSFNKLYRLCV